MTGVSTAAFARRLRSLDDAELLAFVADLWAARGFETTVEGAVVVAARPSGSDDERITCAPATGVEDVDTVIVTSVTAEPEEPRDLRTVGPDDLRGMLLYAVDREIARSLHERHFGRPISAEPEPPVGERIRSVRPRQVAIGALGLILTFGVIIGALGGPPLLGGPEQSVPEHTAASSSPVTDTPVESSFIPAGLADRTPLAMAGPTRGGDLDAPSRYPPGLNGSGVSDVRALASTHRAALDDDSWTLEVRHDGSFDPLHSFTDWTAVEQTIVRTSPSRYRFEVNGVSMIDNRSTAGTTYVDFGDGTANYRRTFKPRFNPFQRTELPADGSTGIFATVSASYVHRYLSTTRTRVEPARIDGRARLLVIATGQPTVIDRPVANYTAVAILDRTGVVHELVVSYKLLERAAGQPPSTAAGDDAAGNVEVVRFRMSLDDLGIATVTPPDWYATARNVTDGTPTQPWPNEPAV